MYRITIDFEADDLEQANDAIDVVKATLPFVVDNIDVGLFHYEDDELERGRDLE